VTASVKNETLGEFLVLKDGNVEGVSHAPAGGWPEPGTETAAVEQAPADDAPAAKAPVAGIKPVVAAASAPAALAAPATPAPAGQQAAAAAPPATPESEEGADATVTAAIEQKPEARAADDVAAAVKTASIDPNADATPENPNCNRDEKYNVIGFNDSSNDLTPRLMARLDQIVADIGVQQCKVLVTGYSSKGGDNATSALFAIERAQHVLIYLRQKGLKFERVAATGGGATDLFGAALAANRRVVITVSP
jgi:outer membrane protein OmpA-like peptidoglycan-associated protein